MMLTGKHEPENITFPLGTGDYFSCQNYLQLKKKQKEKQKEIKSINLICGKESC